MAWNEATVTNLGMALISESLTEGDIVFRKAVGGENCSDPVSMLAQTKIAEPAHPLQIAKLERNGNVITVNVRVQNTGVAKSYMLRQIGLFAGIGADDVLFALIQDETGEVIPPEAENPEFLVEFDFVIPVSNVDRMTIEITPKTFATLDDVAEVLPAIEASKEATKSASAAAAAAQTAAAAAQAAAEAVGDEIDGIVIIDNDDSTKYLGKLRISGGYPALEITQI